MSENFIDNKLLSRRDFLKKSGKVALAVSGGLTLDALLSNCATVSITESREDVANIKWDANPAIHVPKDGCYAGWHGDIVPPRLGAYRNKIWNNLTPKSEEDKIGRYERDYNQTPATHSFSERHVGKDGIFPSAVCEGAHNKGVIPLIRFYFFQNFNKVAKGGYDEQLVRFAQGVEKFGKPFFFTPYPEANIGGAYKHVHPWAGGNGREFRKAWKHMHNIFDGEGANQYAVWGLHLLGFGDRQSFNKFNIEDEFIDWVGFTIYNFHSESFGSLINEGYWWGKRNYPEKPMALWELGTSDTSGQGRWIKNAYNTIKKLPRIKLAVYAEYQFWDTRDSTFISQDSAPIYQKVISDPYFINGGPKLKQILSHTK